jgi:hypothetical protein
MLERLTQADPTFTTALWHGADDTYRPMGGPPVDDFEVVMAR